MMDIHEGKNAIYGLVDGKQVSRIEYRTIGYKDKNIYITNVYTIGVERGKGYASQLMEYIVNKYGSEVNIELSCHPYDISFISDEFAKKFKKLQEDTARWYEKFGFTTSKKEEYDSLYVWKMIRKKNNNI